MPQLCAECTNAARSLERGDVSIDKTRVDLLCQTMTPGTDALVGAHQSVRGCVCFNISFRTLRRMCSDRHERVPQVCRQTRCGSACGLCVPYLQAAIACKADEMGVMWSNDFRELGTSPGRIAMLERAMAKKKRRASEKPAA